MELFTLFIRTLIVYAVVFLILRIMGKREIGKLSVFDLVISIMIAEIAVFVLEDLNKPLIEGFVPMIALMIVQLAIAFVSLKSQRMRRLFEGEPSYVIRGGKLDREEMKRHRYNLDDLLLQLRQNKVMDIADVEFAVLEPSGKLTVMEKTDKRDFIKEEESKADAKKDEHGHQMKNGQPPVFRYAGLPLPLIMDGKVQDQNLEKIGKTRFWLKNEVQQSGLKDFKEVFYCSIDHKGNLFLDKKR